VIATPRLILRRFTLADAPEIQRLAGAREVALNTLMIPHPYPDGAAEEWIGRQEAKAGEEITLAVTLNEALIGGIGLDRLDRSHDHAELGYWIGVPYWGRGYATEAGLAMLQHGFETLALNRIWAMHFVRNPASGRVPQKIGMKHEGRMRQHVKKWGEYVDVEMYGAIRREWLSGDRVVG
jgi:RimJ/RimL family protein N-acetyltransferase